MNILAINTGSSSLKWQLFNSANEECLAKGHFKNHQKGVFSFEAQHGDQKQLNTEVNEKDWQHSIEYIFEFLLQSEIVSSVDMIQAIVHRIVHGGEDFDEPCELNDENLIIINKYNEFAPLHNPYALEKVKQIHESFPFLKQYAVFDTSYHLTMAKEIFLYGLPYGYYENLRIRRYGFHGTSHKYVASRIRNIVDSSGNNSNAGDTTLIVCHLGSGASIAAIKNWCVVDNSFGFSPNENLIMATRAGEIDFDALLFLKKKLGLRDDEIEDILNNDSGLLGISGYTKDMKTLIDDYNSNERARLAVDMFVNKLVEYIAKFYVSLGGCNHLVFTGGVGAGSYVIRQMVCEKLELLGMKISHELNDGKVDVTVELSIGHVESNTAIWVIPTNEELQMVREVKRLIME